MNITGKWKFSRKFLICPRQLYLYHTRTSKLNEYNHLFDQSAYDVFCSSQPDHQIGPLLLQNLPQILQSKEEKFKHFIGKSCTNAVFKLMEVVTSYKPYHTPQPYYSTINLHQIHIIIRINLEYNPSFKARNKTNNDDQKINFPFIPPKNLILVCIYRTSMHLAIKINKQINKNSLRERMRRSNM